MVVVTGGSHKVLLISGKQNGATAGQGGFNSRSISVVLPSSSNPGSSDSDSNSSAGPPLRKRQRLTHLSPEEKALRRKLKNRVAAQTARDRKKAKMGELETQVLELELENEKLLIENEVLRETAGSLQSENDELRKRLGLDVLEDDREEVELGSRGMDAGLSSGSSESAELRLRVPPQKVQAQSYSSLRTSQWIQMVLMLQTMSLISCWAFWTSLTQTISSAAGPQRGKKRCSWEEGAIQYRPPHLQLWGPHQSSWRPLMN